MAADFATVRTRKRERRQNRKEMFSRAIEVSSTRAFIWVSAKTLPNAEPRIDPIQALQFTGMLDEPLRDVREVTVDVFPDDNTATGPLRPPAVGTIAQLRPTVSVIARMPHRDFDRVWSLALHDKLKHSRITFTKPYYTSARLISISFSNVVEE